MATSTPESASESIGNKLDFNKVSLPIFRGTVNGTPVKALYSSGSTGHYMTIACVEKCKLAEKMDTRPLGHINSLFKEEISLLGSINVPIELQVKLPNGQMKTVQCPTLFYVTNKDIVEIVLGCKFPISSISYYPGPGGNIIIGGGEIAFLPRGEWDEPARSTQPIMATRFLQLHS